MNQTPEHFAKEVALRAEEAINAITKPMLARLFLIENLLVLMAARIESSDDENDPNPRAILEYLTPLRDQFREMSKNPQHHPAMAAAIAAIDRFPVPPEQPQPPPQ